MNSTTLTRHSSIKLRNLCIYWTIGLTRICISKTAKKSSLKDHQEWASKCSKIIKMPINWKLSRHSAKRRLAFKNLTSPKKNWNHAILSTRPQKLRRNLMTSSRLSWKTSPSVRMNSNNWSWSHKATSHKCTSQVSFRGTVRNGKKNLNFNMLVTTRTHLMNTQVKLLQNLCRRRIKASKKSSISSTSSVIGWRRRALPFWVRVRIRSSLFILKEERRQRLCQLISIKQLQKQNLKLTNKVAMTRPKKKQNKRAKMKSKRSMIWHVILTIYRKLKCREWSHKNQKWIKYWRVWMSLAIKSSKNWARTEPISPPEMTFKNQNRQRRL